MKEILFYKYKNKVIFEVLNGENKKYTAEDNERDIKQVMKIFIFENNIDNSYKFIHDKEKEQRFKEYFEVNEVENIFKIYREILSNS